MEGNFNFWSIILLISIGQGFILSTMLALRPAQNPVSSRILVTLVVAILIVNIDYFLFSSLLYKDLAALIGISFGFMYLFGPLFYLYLRSVADSEFKWRHTYWLHFIPWLANLLYNKGFYFLDSRIKIAIVDAYLAGKATVNGSLFYWMNSSQIIHLSIYLIISHKLLNRKVKEDKQLVPISSRISWLWMLFYANLVFVLSFVCWFTIVSLQSKFIPPIDYINTLICSAMVFLIAFRLVLNPEVLTPNFDKKYKSSSLTDQDLEMHVAQLIHVMENQKLYTEPELKLNEVADQLGITSHALSQIINEKFGKSFVDFVNEFRVNEFKKRVASVNGEKTNMLSIAMEVGFNSKSAFNAAFKKITNQTPSDYKRGLKSPDIG